MANHNSATSADFKNVRCKDCRRLLGTIEPTGFIACTALRQFCSTCERFELLHAARDAADQAFEVLKDRRKDHKGREAAVEAMNAAHMAFDNWLMLVEAPPVIALGQYQPQDENTYQEVDQGLGQDQRQGKKRHRDSTSSRSTSKRPHIFLTRNRVSFDKSVEFREDEYRKDATYNRISDEYVRGRHAPAAGAEYLDTSGHSLPITKFFGGKWVKGKWVDMRKGEDEEHEEGVVAQNQGEDEEIEQGDRNAQTTKKIDPGNNRKKDEDQEESGDHASGSQVSGEAVNIVRSKQTSTSTATGDNPEDYQQPRCEYTPGTMIENKTDGNSSFLQHAAMTEDPENLVSAGAIQSASTFVAPKRRPEASGHTKEPSVDPGPLSEEILPPGKQWHTTF